MKSLVERTLSGRSACCSYAYRDLCAGLSPLPRPPTLKLRAAAVVMAASVPSQSGRTRAQSQNGRKFKPKAKGKQPANSSPQASKPQRPRTSGSAAMEPAAARVPAHASSQLPGPHAVVSASTPSPPIRAKQKAAIASTVTASEAVLAGGTAPVQPAVGLAPDAVADDANQGSDSDVEEDGFLVEDGNSSEDDSNRGNDQANGADSADTVDPDAEAAEEEVFPEIEFNLPNPTNVKVKTAEYLKSCVSVSECPAPRFPEFAVIGRSNVGKSSLINMLTGRKDLALVSKQPGKTKCINHFLINGSWYFVDLPGYGFAKIGIQGRQQFDSFSREYFKTRPNLAMVFLLVDASIPPQKIDLDYANWLTDNEVPFTLVFTKADKRRKSVPTSALDSHITAFKRALLKDLAFLPPSILTSSARGLGRGEMLNFIGGLRAAFERSGRLAAIRQGML